MNDPNIWFFLMLCALGLWGTVIHRHPKYFGQATNALAWFGILTFMVLNSAPTFLVIGSMIYAAAAIPLSFLLTQNRINKK